MSEPRPVAPLKFAAKARDRSERQILQQQRVRAQMQDRDPPERPWVRRTPNRITRGPL